MSGGTPVIYGQLVAYMDGKLLTQNVELDVEVDGDDQIVKTICLEFAGITPGPKHMACSLKNVVPPTGVDFDAFNAYLLSERHELRVQELGGTGKSMTTSGFCQKPKRSAGVGKTTGDDYTFIGTPASFV